MFKLSHIGFKAFKQMLDPKRFVASLKQQVTKATIVNARFLEKEIKDSITEARIGPNNRPLTVMIKRRDHPLLDSGRMRDSLRYEIVDWRTAVIGIPTSSPSYKIAKWVSEGRSVPVTESMRRMFFMLWLVSEGEMEPSRLQGRAAELWARSKGPWFPLSPSTRIIRIPKRPFISVTTKRKDVKAAIRQRYWQAVKDAWRFHVKDAVKAR